MMSAGQSMPLERPFGEPNIPLRTPHALQEQNKVAARRYLDEIWNKANLGAVDELYAPYFVDHTPAPGTTADREGLKQSLLMLRRAFPDGRFTVHELIAEGDYVTGRFSFKGTHLGELDGSPPTGKTVTIQGISLSRFANGKIVESWELTDQWLYLRQIGIAKPS